MQETTISVQNSGSYDKIQLEHDNRERDGNGQPYFSKNVDSSRSSENWYWEGNMSIKEFYETAKSTYNGDEDYNKSRAYSWRKKDVINRNLKIVL